MLALVEICVGNKMEEGGNQPYRWMPQADAANNPPPPVVVPNPALAQYPPQNAGAQNYPPPNPQPALAPFPQLPNAQMVILQNNVWTRIGQVALCPSCNQQVMTLARYKHYGSLLPWISCCLIAFTGCYCCCCWIPFAINECKTVEHSCPQCGNRLGRRSIL